jgi:hypothetical protein
MKVDTNRIAEAVFLRPQNETPAARAQKAASEDFAALLEERAAGQAGAAGSAGSAMELLSGSQGAGRGAAAEFLSRNSLSQLQLSLLKADTVGAAGPPSPQEAAEKIEETLALLEEYAVSLGDPSSSLKDLAPLAEELSASAGGLDGLSRRLPEDDPLRELGSETASLAAVEALKFRRGDFV